MHFLAVAVDVEEADSAVAGAGKCFAITYAFRSYCR